VARSQSSFRVRFAIQQFEAPVQGRKIDVDRVVEMVESKQGDQGPML
jgi:hypothetical protein